MGLTQKLGTIPLAILTDASNNVGIGAAPSGTYKLEVTGTAKVSSTLLVSGAATFSSSVQAGSSSATNYATLQIMGASTSPSLTTGTAANVVFAMAAGQELAITANGTAPYGVNFQARNSLAGGGGSGTSYPIIFNPLGGNVGIGTSSPSYSLHIVSTSSWLKASYSSAGDTRATELYYTGIKTTASTSQSNNMLITMEGGYTPDGSGSIVFSTGSPTASERMRIASSGVVSITNNNLGLNGKLARLYSSTISIGSSGTQSFDFNVGSNSHISILARVGGRNGSPSGGLYHLFGYMYPSGYLTGSTIQGTGLTFSYTWVNSYTIRITITNTSSTDALYGGAFFEVNSNIAQDF